MRKILFFSFLFMAITYSGSFALDCKKTDDSFAICSTAISVPKDKIILIKKNKILSNKYAYGAIKFLEIKDKEAKYEWYYQSNDSGDFENKNTKSGLGLVNFKYWTLIGRLSFQLGNTEIICGKMKLGWSPRSSIYFVDDEGNDTGIQMAPTKWTDIKEVDVFDNNLIWYKYDESRKEEIIINIENLNN